MDLSLANIIGGLILMGMGWIARELTYLRREQTKMNGALIGFDGKGGALADIRQVRRNGQRQGVLAQHMMIRFVHNEEWMRRMGTAQDFPFVPLDWPSMSGTEGESE